MCPFNPIAPRKAKIVYNFGLSECNRVKDYGYIHVSTALSRNNFCNNFLFQLASLEKPL